MRNMLYLQVINKFGVKHQINTTMGEMKEGEKGQARLSKVLGL